MDDEFDARELLSLLTGKHQSLERVSAGLSGLTGEDIALALGMTGDIYAESLPNIAALLGRVKYAGDSPSAPRLAELVMRHAVLYRRIDWPTIPRPGFIREIAMLALVESVDPHTCPWCQGQKWRMIGPRKVICTGCKGTGTRLPGHSERARLMGVEWKPWEKPYEEIQDILSRADGMLQSALSSRLRKNER